MKAIASGEINSSPLRRVCCLRGPEPKNVALTAKIAVPSSALSSASCARCAPIGVETFGGGTGSGNEWGNDTGGQRYSPSSVKYASIRPADAEVTTSSMRARVNTYTGYSIGCVAVWGAILLAARRRLDAKTRTELQLVCSGWWIGWTSATIARIGYPPPKQLTAVGEKRLRIVSSVLVALGLSSAIHMLVTGKRPRRSAPDS